MMKNKMISSLSVLSFAACFFMSLAVLVGSLIPMSHAVLPGSDKTIHFLAYAALSGSAMLGFLTRSMGLAKKSTGKSQEWQFGYTLSRGFWIFLFFLSFGGSIEILQGYTGRTPEWGDFLANGLGAVGGIVLMFFMFQIVRRIGGSGHLQ